MKTGVGRATYIAEESMKHETKVNLYKNLIKYPQSL